MAQITMLDLRKNSEQLLKMLGKKEKVILSYRGRPIATIHPILEEEDSLASTVKSLKKTKRPPKGTKLSNAEIDELVYGVKFR